MLFVDCEQGALRHDRTCGPHCSRMFQYKIQMVTCSKFGRTQC